jgi:hypothetical protein
MSNIQADPSRECKSHIEPRPNSDIQYSVKDSIKELVDGSNNLEEAHREFERDIASRLDFERFAELARSTFTEHIEATERQLEKARIYEDVLKHLRSAIVLYNAYKDTTWSITNAISDQKLKSWTPTDRMVQHAANTLQFSEFCKTRHVWSMPLADYMRMMELDSSDTEQEWRMGVDEAGNFFDEAQGIGLQYMPDDY